jgi:hypothetical protein
LQNEILRLTADLDTERQTRDLYLNRVNQLTKSLTQTWYNSDILESFTNIYRKSCSGIFGKTYTTLELDEYPINNVSLFTKALFQFGMEWVGNKTPLYTPILRVLKEPTKWIYFNAERYDMNVYYEIKHKSKTYYISYLLLGVYVNIHEFKDETLNIRSKTAVIDPLLRLMMTSSREFYEEYNSFNIKLGHYYIEITDYIPQIKYTYMGKASNLTYPFYKSKICYDIPPVIIPKQIKINMNNSVSYRLTRLELKHDPPNTIKFEKDRYTVHMGFYTNTIIVSHITKKRPTIPSRYVANHTYELTYPYTEDAVREY